MSTIRLIEAEMIALTKKYIVPKRLYIGYDKLAEAKKEMVMWPFCVGYQSDQSRLLDMDVIEVSKPDFLKVEGDPL